MSDQVTSNMMNAGADAMHECMAMLNSGRSYQSVCVKIYEAMQEASPPLPQQGGEQAEVPDDTLGRLYVGKGTAGDQMLAHNALCHDRLIGMAVSMDVSTGEDDATHRVFGRVAEVMLKSAGSDEDTILAIEESRNFTSDIDRELLEAAQIVFGKLGGNQLGGEYRREWEKCRDALNGAAVLPKAGEAKPIYQVVRAKAGGGWIDVEREIYDTAADWNRRIVYSAPAGLGEAKAVAPVAWWNGFRTYDEREGTYPSFHESESTNHDIPVYAGINPCNLAAPIAQALPVAAEKDGIRIRVLLKVDYVDCPICFEPDMRKETDVDGNSLIHCVNHACPTNDNESTTTARGYLSELINDLRSKIARLNAAIAAMQGEKA